MKTLVGLLLVMFVATLTACGGGGGGGSSSLSYDGTPEQATIDSENAADLSALAYYGSELNDPLPIPMSQNVVVSLGAPLPVIPKVAEQISSLPSNINLSAFQDSASRAAMTIPAQTEECGISPDISGSMTISGSYDELSGQLNARISFSSCDVGDGIVINGAIVMSASGITDIENPVFSQVPFTIDFQMLSYEWLDGGDNILMDGLATSYYDSDIAAQIMEMNMVMQEVYSGQMAKLENYQIAQYIGDGIEISGRIYDSIVGYVDITTDSRIFINSEGPYQGVYRIEGSDGTWAIVDFGTASGDQGTYGDLSGSLGTFYL